MSYKRLEAGILPQMTGDLDALFLDGQSPAIAAEVRLESPFQQVQQQHDQAIFELLLFTAPQALDLFGNMFDVGAFRSPARSKAACSWVQA